MASACRGLMKLRYLTVFIPYLIGWKKARGRHVTPHPYLFSLRNPPPFPSPFLKKGEGSKCLCFLRDCFLDTIHIMKAIPGTVRMGDPNNGWRVAESSGRKRNNLPKVSFPVPHINGFKHPSPMAEECFGVIKADAMVSSD